MAIVFVGYKILEIRKISDFKIYLKILGTRLIGILVPLIIFAIYLTFNGIWIDFIDYTILGLKTFSNTVLYENLLNEILYTILAYMIPINIGLFVLTYIFTLSQKDLKDKDWAKRLRILLVYDIATISAIYPIADKNHFAIGTICTLITSVYLIYEIIVYSFKILNKKKLIFALKTFFETVSLLIMIVFVAKALISVIGFIQGINGQTYLNHFKYIPTSENLQTRINMVDEYILEQKENGIDVYILDTMAAAYIIPTDEYHKNYDMFNLGNFGSRGTERNNRRFRKRRKYNSTYYAR